jgi:hypothetical protein
LVRLGIRHAQDVYPVTAIEWIHQSDAAISPLLRLTEILAGDAANLTQAHQIAGERWVLASSASRAIARDLAEGLVGDFEAEFPGSWFDIILLSNPEEGAAR